MLDLGQHIRHLTSYGPPVIVGINKFVDDTDEELEIVARYARSMHVEAVVCDPWSKGGPGCEDLAEAVSVAAAKPSTFKNVYERSDNLHTKIEKLNRTVYGGDKVTFSAAAEKRLAWAESHGYGDLPVCVAKTQMSLSDDAKAYGAPKGFELHVRDIKISAGAGFLVAVCGDIMLMPGMGKTPAAIHIDVDDSGTIHGLN